MNTPIDEQCDYYKTPPKGSRNAVRTSLFLILVVDNLAAKYARVQLSIMQPVYRGRPICAAGSVQI